MLGALCVINDRWSWSSNHYDDDHWCEHVRCAGREKLDDDNVLEEEEEEEDHWCEHVRCAGQEKPTTCSHLSLVERQPPIQNSDQNGKCLTFQLVRLSRSLARSFLNRWPTPSGWWLSLRWCWCWSSQCCWCSIQCWRLPTLRLQCGGENVDSQDADTDDADDADDADKEVDADDKVDSQPGFLQPPWSSLVAAYRQLSKVKWTNLSSIINYHSFISLSSLSLSPSSPPTRKIPIGGKFPLGQKGYGNFPIWQFVFENCHIIFIEDKC